MKYALYLGCTIPSRMNHYDASTRRVAEGLGIELVDLEGAGCCGPVFVRSINRATYVAMAARNLALAERMGLDVVTLCNGCFGALVEARHVLKEDERLRVEVNGILKEEGLEFKGSSSVKHFVQVLYHDYGLSKIKSRVVNPFRGLKTAVHYGCHVLRPSEITKFDRAEDPSLLDRLVEVTGTKSVNWLLKTMCCGAPTLAASEETALQLVKMKLDSAKKAGADCMVTICPFCEVMFDTQQLKIAFETGQSYDLPALFYPQLLGLSMGLKPDDVGLGMNRIPAEKVLDFLSKKEG